ncbi:hypothetical protein [Oerskovia flava]|uniref:hypothetical protein n=1 Tax=Oerskovia flava TaxID=2986422 RepID=UPI002240A806|nr:hypothetical protein [Oerskovia sp. JB1-3-2]
MVVAIYGVRPLYMVQRDSFDFYGLRVTDGFALATWIGLAALVAMYLGYTASAMHRSRSRARVDGSERKSPSTGGIHAADPTPTHVAGKPEISILAASVACAGLVVAWFVLLAVYGGGAAFLTLMFSGRSAQVSQRMEGMPAVVMALPVVGVLVVAVVRVLVERTRRLHRPERLTYWVVTLLAIVPTSVLGTRRFLLPVLLAAIIAALAPSWNRRIRLRHAGIGLVGLLALAIIPFVRSAGSRTGDASLAGAMRDYYATEGPAAVMENFFLSYDTEMFAYVSYVAPRLGGDLPLGMGRGTFLEVMMAPVPAALVPTESWSNERLRTIFGGSCVEYLCPVPSLPGALYFDFALPGVIVGMFLFGWALHVAGQSFTSATGTRLVVVVAFISFIPNIVRGNPASQLAILVQVIIVAVGVLWLLRKMSGLTRVRNGGRISGEEGGKLLPRGVDEAHSASRGLMNESKRGTH